jgi:hypothetical protein
MEWVFDTSITMAWCFDDECTARTESLLESLGGRPAAVPGHWSLEVANVLALATKAGRITAAAISREIKRNFRDITHNI